MLTFRTRPRSIRSENVAKLFEQFCLYLKIRCRTLSGWARGGKSHIGRRLQSGSLRHTWNAVYIRKQWRVLDVAWGFECASHTFTFIHTHTHTHIHIYTHTQLWPLFIE